MDTFVNFAIGQILTAPTPPTTGTTITLLAGGAAHLPPIPCTIAIFSGTTYATPDNAELARVTAIAGDTLTITRAIEGTTARAIIAGDYIAQTFTAQFVADLRNSANQNAGTLPDARLSANVPLKTTPNTFIAAQTLETVFPALVLHNTADPVDGSLFRIINATQFFYIQALNDAMSAVQGGVRIDRAGNLLAAGLGATPLDASQLTGGTMPAARLPANVALTDAGNIFTQQQVISGANLALHLYDSVGPADGKRWSIVPASGYLYFQALNDASNVQTGAVTIDHAGVLTAPAGLGATPIAASHLTGTIPDSTLSANVAKLNAQNVFTGTKQSIVAGNPTLLLKDVLAPVDQTVFRCVNTGGRLYFQALTDNEATAQGAIAFDRVGNVLVDGDLYEQGRATPLGHWIDIPYNAANFGAGGAVGAWTVAAANVVNFRYTLIGKTAAIQLIVNHAVLTGAPTYLYVVLPFSIMAGQSNAFYQYIAPALNGSGLFIQPTTDQYARFYRDPFNTAYIASADTYVYFSAVVQIL